MSLMGEISAMNYKRWWNKNVLIPIENAVIKLTKSFGRDGKIIENVTNVEAFDVRNRRYR